MVTAQELAGLAAWSMLCLALGGITGYLAGRAGSDVDEWPEAIEEDSNDEEDVSE